MLKRIIFQIADCCVWNALMSTRTDCYVTEPQIIDCDVTRVIDANRLFAGTCDVHMMIFFASKQRAQIFFCQNCLWDLNLKLNFRIFYSEINLNDETSDFCRIVGNRIQNMYFIKKFIKSLFWCVFLLSVKIKIKYSK